MDHIHEVLSTLILQIYKIKEQRTSTYSHQHEYEPFDAIIVRDLGFIEDKT